MQSARDRKRQREREERQHNWLQTRVMGLRVVRYGLGLHCWERGRMLVWEGGKCSLKELNTRMLSVLVEIQPPGQQSGDAPSGTCSCMFSSAGPYDYRMTMTGCHCLMDPYNWRVLFFTGRRSSYKYIGILLAGFSPATAACWSDQAPFRVPLTLVFQLKRGHVCSTVGLKNEECHARRSFMASPSAILRIPEYLVLCLPCTRRPSPCTRKMLRHNNYDRRLFPDLPDTRTTPPLPCFVAATLAQGYQSKTQKISWLWPCLLPRSLWHGTASHGMAAAATMNQPAGQSQWKRCTYLS